MPLLRKSNDYVGLEKIPVFAEDTRATSTYFRIFDVPEILPAGKFAFRINGSTLLKVGSEIRVEVLDVEGNVIYTEYPQYLEGTSRLISVYVYPDTLYGVATITVVGEAIDVSNDWRDRPNVRWQKQVLVDPNLRNDDKIRFYNTPIIYSREKYTPYLNRTYLTSSLPEDANYSTGKVRGEHIGSDYMVTAVDGSFIRQMIGGQLTVTTPSKSSAVTYDQEYSTEIKDIINSKTLIAKSSYQVTANLPASYKNLKYNIKNFDDEVFEIPTETTRFVDSEFNIRYEVEPTYSVTENYRSYAKVTVADMDTFSGDIYSTKLFMKSVGSGRDYELVGDDILETRELLLDSGSANLDERYGYFYGQYIIDGFWEQSLYNIEGSLTSSRLLHTRDKILDSMYVSGTDTARAAEDYSIIKPIQSAEYFANTEYTFDSKMYARIKLKNITNDDGSTSTGKKARLLIYMSGSAFNQTLHTEDRFNGLGKLVREIEIRNLQGSITDRNFGQMTQGFIADNTGIGTPLFVIDSGDWWFSDVTIEAAQETGFSPGTTTFIIPINDWQRDDRLQFKSEFYNYRGIRADVIATSSEQTFKGSNFYLQGTDNVLTGSMFIGNSIGKGIEMAGVQSAYLRNVGYLGYSSASDGSGPSGFMIWSGSVLNDINPGRYGGVGLELHGGAGADALRFRSDTGVLEITGSIRVSGSGWIGGWIISETGLTGSGGIIATSATGQRIVINESGDNTLKFYESGSEDWVLNIDDGIYDGKPGITIVNPSIANQFTSITSTDYFQRGSVAGPIMQVWNQYSDNSDSAGILGRASDISSNTYNRLIRAVQGDATIALNFNDSSAIGVWGEASVAQGGGWAAGGVFECDGFSIRLFRQDDNDIKADFSVDSAGILIIAPSGQQLLVSGSISASAFDSVAYKMDAADIINSSGQQTGSFKTRSFIQFGINATVTSDDYMHGPGGVDRFECVLPYDCIITSVGLAVNTVISMVGADQCIVAVQKVTGLTSNTWGTVNSGLIITTSDHGNYYKYITGENTELSAGDRIRVLLSVTVDTDPQLIKPIVTIGLLSE